MNKQNARKGETILELCIALMLIAIVGAITLSLTQLTSLSVKQSVASQDRLQDVSLAKNVVDTFVGTYDDSEYTFTVSSDGNTLTATKGYDAYTLTYEKEEQTLQNIDLSSFTKVTFSFVSSSGENDYKMLCINFTYEADNGSEKTITQYKAIRAATIGGAN